MTDESIDYPTALDRQAISELLPHRGDIFACQSLVVDGPRTFTGAASWPLESSLIQGHFPGLPVVPAVMLIEASAQLAGAGLLAGDPYVRSLPKDLVGVIATIRKCVFSKPVLPESQIEYSIQCRQMGPLAVQVVSTAKFKDAQIAQFDFLMVYVPRDQLLAALGK